jgi:hypothetical protein
MKMLGIGVVVVALFAGILLFTGSDDIEYKPRSDQENPILNATEKVKEIFAPDLGNHIETPDEVKAIYMTSWVAGTTDWRNELISYIEESNLNSIVVDIKDDTGRISFEVNDPDLHKIGSFERRIADIDALTDLLHEKDIYVIGRVSVFQDPYLVSKRPELAVRRASDRGMWQDRKGLTWLDAGNREVWEYAVSIARESYSRGFDEINFDYIRFPSDGNMADIYYPESEGKERAVVMESFFKYLNEELGEEMTISADLFGLVTYADDDLGIGQEIMRAVPYFDYISPMVYPSHFASGTFGYSDPASRPYEIVFGSIETAVERLTATSTKKLVTVGTTTKTVYEPRESFPKEKLRPWLQDFDLGADYGKAEVEAQIKALNDLDLYSWMIWDPSNRYTRGVSY